MQESRDLKTTTVHATCNGTKHAIVVQYIRDNVSSKPDNWMTRTEAVADPLYMSRLFITFSELGVAESSDGRIVAHLAFLDI